MSCGRHGWVTHVYAFFFCAHVHGRFIPGIGNYIKIHDLKQITI